MDGYSEYLNSGLAKDINKFLFQTASLLVPTKFLLKEENL